MRGEGGAVVGCCQLMLAGDPGDATMPSTFHHTLRHGECYLEWIAVSEAARNQGVVSTPVTVPALSSSSMQQHSSSGGGSSSSKSNSGCSSS